MHTEIQRLRGKKQTGRDKEEKKNDNQESIKGTARQYEGIKAANLCADCSVMVVLSEHSWKLSGLASFIMQQRYG